MTWRLVRTLPSICVSAISLLAAGVPADARTAAGEVIFTQVPVRPGAADLGPDVDLVDGSRIARFDPARPDRAPVVLTPGFRAAGRPDLSFDARRVLFVGRREAGDPLDVWEMNVDGSGARRVTSGNAGNCDSPVYLSTIYTIDAEAPVHQVAFGSDAGGGRALYACRMDGTRTRQITFDPHGASDPFQLGDGRLLFSGGRSADSARDGARGSALFTVNTDGTDVFVFAAAHEAPAMRGMPCETDRREVVYVESKIGDDGGSLVAVSRTASLHSRRVVAHDPEGLYRAPAALGDGRLLVSHRSREGGSWGLHVLDMETGVRTATVYDASRWHEIDAVPVRPRVEPPGRSSVVDDRVETALLYCISAYIADGEHAPLVDGGSIAGLQVFGGARERGGGVRETLLGVAPVEADGSFYLRIPARTPLRLQTVDAEGEVLQAMRSWFWAMPKESRGCIGCHEDRELSPPNRHALALRKAAFPIDQPDANAAEYGTDDSR